MIGGVDAHQHFWSLPRGDYGWLTPQSGSIYRDFGPRDLAPLLEDAGIARTVLVQAAPTEAETRYLLDIAAATPYVAAVVGWVDLAARNAPDRLALLAGHARMVIGLEMFRDERAQRLDRLLLQPLADGQSTS